MTDLHKTERETDVTSTWILLQIADSGKLACELWKFGFYSLSTYVKICSQKQLSFNS